MGVPGSRGFPLGVLLEPPPHAGTMSNKQIARAPKLILLLLRFGKFPINIIPRKVRLMPPHKVRPLLGADATPVCGPSVSTSSVALEVALTLEGVRVQVASAGSPEQDVEVNTTGKAPDCSPTPKARDARLPGVTEAELTGKYKVKSVPFTLTIAEDP